MRLRSDLVIEFIEAHLLVPEGTFVGEKVILRDWQKDIIRQIYDTPTRRAIITMGRKNGKTSMIAMLLLAHLVGPASRKNAQIYSAAQSRDQSSLVFNLAAKMIRMSPTIAQHVVIRDTIKEFLCTLNGVRYRALSADATTAYGLSPALVIHDELGQVVGPQSPLYDALETAMGAHQEPLSLIISTQSPTDADLLSTLIDDARTSDDPETKLIVYAADMEDDPYVEATWRKANPALGDFRSLKELKGSADRAKRLSSFESVFRNLYLNQRVAAENNLVSKSVWDQCGRSVDQSVFQEFPVWGGLDLSSRQDLTALVLVARDDALDWHVWCHFWAPEAGLRERSMRDRAPYDVWVREGLLTATPGASIDLAWVAHKLGEVCEDFDVRGIAYDPWRIKDLQREIDERGFDIPLEEFGQGYKSMSPAVEALETEAINGRICHGMHPILTWCAANCIARPDPAGNRKPDKSKSTGRIDGMVALIMALGLASKAPAPEPVPISVYELLARQRQAELRA